MNKESFAILEKLYKPIANLFISGDKVSIMMKIVIPLLIAVFLVGFLTGGTFIDKTIVKVQQAEQLPAPKIFTTEEPLTSQIKVPAVDDNGNGVVTTIGLQVKKGSGRTLVDLGVLSFVDTQSSIRTARDVAQDVTGLDLSETDLIYSIDANASVIEGPSAGGAITVMTIAAVEGKQLKPDVMMTGQILPDGKIGMVGAIPEKILAAKEVGAKVMLVPRGGAPSRTNYVYERVTKCDKPVRGVEYCRTEYVRKESSQSNGFGIEVKEVATIRDALKYFLEDMNEDNV